MSRSSIQPRLFDVSKLPRIYQDSITASVNRKGCMDVDTVKGCTAGMSARAGGCYGECYANKIASRYGIAFGHSVKRGFVDQYQHRDVLVRQLRAHHLAWYRIGVMGDPSYDWNHTVAVIRHLRPADSAAVIVTKHWRVFTDEHLSKLIDLDVVVHTSTSGLDTDAETKHRLAQMTRLRKCGIPIVNRVVTCEYGDSEWAAACRKKQEYLLTLDPVIDTPLRVRASNPRVMSGEIRVTRRRDSVGGGTLVSLNNQTAYLGDCASCPDQCGVKPRERREAVVDQRGLFGPVVTAEENDQQLNGATEFRHVESVIGSGFEKDVAELALEDGIAHRAARKNMQIHSAIILLVGGDFAGFFTFQVNREVGEFCLLQSVIRPDVYTPELYRAMAEQIIEHNTDGLPMLMTTNPKSKFETPALFKDLGFHTYLKTGGFEYMLLGDNNYSRLKTLAHISMTNVWNSVKGNWLALKKEWKARINMSGEAAGIENPGYASREGGWQGEQGFANVVTGRHLNHNVSVLDPVACEVILRMFSPDKRGRVYNPFGGGVQMGYVCGASGYKYVASEIRKNQCDANNAICGEFSGVKWVQSDSSTYKPRGKFDLVFACPPYYRVEKYIDYDGKPPEGEINSMGTYAEFCEALFAGYRIAIEHLNDNRFIVIMTGDSRDKHGAYHCHECDTELFLKSEGLSIYNKIIYLEPEFTRLAQAKKTLHHRKFPKREQRIIVAYKGNMKSIIDEFPTIGRL